jgi:spore coat protein H
VGAFAYELKMKHAVYAVLSLMAGLAAFAKSDPGAEFFGSAELRTFKITLGKEQQAALADNNRNRQYVSATVAVGGVTYSNVAIRLKGMGSFRPLNEKPSLAVKFDEYVDDQKFLGLSKIMLNNSSQDPTYLAELVSMSMFRDAGLPAPRVTHAFVELNGRKLGTYVAIEAVNKDFLRRTFKNTSGTMYEAYLQDIDQSLDQDNGVNIKQRDRKALVEACNISDLAERWLSLQRVLNVDQFIDHTVLEMFVSHTDGYAINRNNYRLYNDPTSGRFWFITLGADWGFQNPNISIHPPMSTLLVKAVLQTPQGRTRYRERFRTLYTNVFNVPVLSKRVDDAVARLKAANPGGARQYERYGAATRDAIAQRDRSIAEQLAAPEPEPLKFDASGFASIPGWKTKIETGDPVLVRHSESNRVDLHIDGGKDGCIASWRSRAVLNAGKYRFQARARCAGIDPRTSSSGTGAGVRISGGQRTNKLQGNKDWTVLQHDFEGPSDGSEVEFVCELRANKGKVWFDRESLKLKKL